MVCDVIVKIKKWRHIIVTECMMWRHYGIMCDVIMGVKEPPLVVPDIYKITNVK